MLKNSLLNIITMAVLLAPSFLCNKIALVQLEPLTIVSVRIGLAAILLAGLLRYKKISFKVSKTFLAHSFILGFFSNGFPFVCFCYSLFYIPTSLSALINGMMPVFSIVLARLCLQEQLTANKAMGIFLGVLGFCVLFIPSLLSTQMAFNPWGMCLCLMGAISYAIAAVYGRKRVIISINPLLISLYQLLSCLIYLIPFAILFESPLRDFSLASWPTWSALTSLALFGTALSTIIYYDILLKQGVAAVSMVTYLLPIMSTVLGVAFLKETMHYHFIIAALCILMGVILVNKKPQV